MILNFKTAAIRAPGESDHIWATTPDGVPVRLTVSSIVELVLNSLAAVDEGIYNPDADTLIAVKADGSLARVSVTLGSGAVLGQLSFGVAPTTIYVDVVSGLGQLSFASDSVSVLVTVSDVVDLPIVDPGRLATYGNQFINSDGLAVRLRSVNWFGAEGTNFTPHGTWARRYTDILDDIAAMGFNCIRLPFSGDFSNASLAPPGTSFDADLNPEFVGLTSLEIFDLIIDYAGNVGLFVVLDHHRATAGNGADGSPVQLGYTIQSWLDTWAAMAARYADNLTVIGADVHNEPHSLDWATWAGYAEQCGNAIHAVAPEWLIFVEGVGEYGGESYWWGGQLKGVSSRPVSLSQSNKLAYSPHEYGVSVGEQAWLKSSSNTSVANWPNNLYAVWQNAWGFIYEQAIAPIWVGEFGGHFGVDGSGTVGAMPNGTYESEWVAELCKYLNGDLNGDGIRDIASTDQGMSFSYWSYNPNSGDTGGLMQDDWITRQTVKLSLIDPVLDAIPAEILNIGSLDGRNHFKVQLAEDGETEVTTVSMAAIEAGFEQPPYFTVVGNAVQFQARIDGPTTAGSSYVRAELREVNADGTDAGFDALAGVNWIRGKTRITHLPPIKPEVVIAQLFNGSADRIAIRTQVISGETKLVCRINGSAVTPRLMESYAPGTEFEWMILVNNGIAEIYFNDMLTPLITSSALLTTGSDSWYFKAGAYSQSNATIDDPSEYVSVELRAFGCGHS
jgi:endoglucanase